MSEGQKVENRGVMDGAVPGRAALRAIEDRFRFLVERYGFELTQSSDAPAMAWYQASERALVVSYDVSRELPLEIVLEAPPSPRYELFGMIALRNPAAAPRPSGPYSLATLTAELQLATEALHALAQAFLSGDLASFRQASRESGLVAACRDLARGAYFDGDYLLATRLYEALREYWDERDRETFELARRGQTPLTKASKR